MNSIETLKLHLIETNFKSLSKVSFVALRGYTDAKGEIQNCTINVGLSYERAKLKDVKFLSDLNVSKFSEVVSLESHGFGVETLEEARLELLEALINPSVKRSEGQINAFSFVCRGLKQHIASGDYYIFGYSVTKTVVIAGETKVDTRKPLTKAKDFLRSKFLKAAKYRQYNVSRLTSIALNKTTLEIG